jgi:hypothetical protein
MIANLFSPQLFAALALGAQAVAPAIPAHYQPLAQALALFLTGATGVQLQPLAKPAA